MLGGRPRALRSKLLSATAARLTEPPPATHGGGSYVEAFLVEFGGWVVFVIPPHPNLSRGERGKTFMIYGLYLSASGIAANSYRQDVIANNLANSETAGFKRDVPSFKQRLTEAQQGRRPGSWSDSRLEGMGGGLLAMPNHIDFSSGAMEQTGSPLDVAIQGDGFFAVKQNDQTLLTRDGRFSVNSQGQLVMSSGQRVLDGNGQPIGLSSTAPVTIEADGQITQEGQAVGKLGVFSVGDKSTLTKVGSNLLAPQNANDVQRADAKVRSEFREQSNVDPATEMVELLETQRQIEANANMIQAQDATLKLAVGSVGKIS
jgi:flagellar basal-body rod protein FlgF